MINNACYFCNGTGLTQSDIECFCFNGNCPCQYCKKAGSSK